MMEDKFVEQQGTYMLSHSVGLPLKTAKSATDIGFWHPWSKGGENVWDHWLAGIERFRAILAKLLNSDSSQFCPQSNISSAVNKIIFSLERSEHKKVILMSAAYVSAAPRRSSTRRLLRTSLSLHDLT